MFEDADVRDADRAAVDDRRDAGPDPAEVGVIASCPPPVVGTVGDVGVQVDQPRYDVAVGALDLDYSRRVRRGELRFDRRDPAVADADVELPIQPLSPVENVSALDHNVVEHRASLALPRSGAARFKPDRGALAAQRQAGHLVRSSGATSRAWLG